jgi:hypothetical protein
VEVITMAGIGPAPKDPSQRARRNKPTQPQTILRFEHAEAPDLPTFEIERDGDLVEFTWPARTVAWWEMWKASPQAEHFGSTDWDFLLDTAVIHARFWRGDLSLAAELRLRVAKHGATMEDRARLRMAFAEADEADGGKGSSGADGARERYAKLRVIKPGDDGKDGKRRG